MIDKSKRKCSGYNSKKKPCKYKIKWNNASDYCYYHQLQNDIKKKNSNFFKKNANVGQSPRVGSDENEIILSPTPPPTPPPTPTPTNEINKEDIIKDLIKLLNKLILL